jgi:YVTN family beta-propeller protein
MRSSGYLSVRRRPFSCGRSALFGRCRVAPVSGGDCIITGLAYRRSSAHAVNAYITSLGGNTVSVINTAINAVIATINVGTSSAGVAVAPDGSKVYIATDFGSVSVIDTTTNTVIGSPIAVGQNPFGVAVTSASKDYVTNEEGTVSVIDTATNTVIATIPAGLNPTGVAVAPPARTPGLQNDDLERRCRLHQDDEQQTDEQEHKKVVGSKVYVADSEGNSVVVIATATDTVIARIPVGRFPFGVAVTPDGCKVYVSNGNDATVSVIATATDTVIGSPIPVGRGPTAVAVTPNGRKVYVENFSDNTVSVIGTATNTVIATIPVDRDPDGLGLFIQPGPRFAGTPGKSNCFGKSVSALVREFHGLNAAAEAVGFRSIRGLEEAALEFREE